MNNLKQNCTLLLNTCDSYSDCWEPFFKLLTVQWKNFDMNVVINTESKRYTYEGLNIKMSNCRASWGKRLITALDSIDSKYILFCLEDFLLESPVAVEEVEKCYEYMEQNPDIACFCFYPTEDQNNMRSQKYVGFEQRPQSGEYRLNCQIALWNREKLRSYIRPHENPWEWELYGSRRSSRYNAEFYSICNDAPKVFDYKNGGALRRGRWWMEMVLPLDKQYGFNIDYSKRGTFEDFQQNPPKRKRKLWRGIKNRINKLRSLI
ncbi:MAG: hypothetical protein IJO75_04720 [Clostridia bacterium]|nr:hypothetical protein [Clostridia bacterium]